MLADDLFQQILLAPAKQEGVNRLQIVSGFATASMADRHMEYLADLNLSSISIDLIVGMARINGIEKAQHYALREMEKSRTDGMDFSCRYIVESNPVHAKTYCWLKGDKPVAAFVGSANYTQTAFGRRQVEAMAEANPLRVAEFYQKMRRLTVDCMDSDIANKIRLIETRPEPDNAETVALSLLDRRTGETPTRSGINWGQRESRNKDQAYINIPTKVGNTDFFPPRGEQFTVLTDDDYSFIMVRAQDGGKGLHTTQDNALLGKYLRDRMGLPSGKFVTRKHLIKYGRKDVSFTKIDDETYFMDFRPILGPGEDAEMWQD